MAVAKPGGEEARSGDRPPEPKKLAPASHLKTEEYYRRLRRLLRVGLAIAYLVPLAILSLYFHFQFNQTIKKSGKLHLVILAESQRNTIDLFLQERVLNIFNLFRGRDFKLAPTPDDMRRYLQHLREMSDAFVDVGFLTREGLQIGYAGPYPYLQGKDYSREKWFRTLMDQDQNYLISDIYLGFRKKPHFTIAVRQLFDGAPFVMRATLDPDKFYMFLRTIGQGKGGESALINRRGYYQIVDPEHGELLGRSDYLPAEPAGSGANEIKVQGDTELIAYSWLEEVPWVLVVRQPLRVAYAEMYRARQIMIVSTVALALVVLSAIWITTDRLLRRAQAVEESRKELRSQLLRAAKLVSVGELAAGVAHEINNPLAIISATNGVIRDMFDPQFEIEWNPDQVRQELDHIDQAVMRAKGITQKLLELVRHTEHRLATVDLNHLLDEVVSGLLEREFLVANIQLLRDYAPDLPRLRLDPDQIRQVFLNIINNAGDAIEGSGTISLSTHRDDQFIRVTIADTGKGMTAEQMGKIFLPFYTTKEAGKGTGLGLSISLSIVESMAGRIEVQSMPGAGSSFTVVLPVQPVEEETENVGEGPRPPS